MIMRRRVLTAGAAIGLAAMARPTRARLFFDRIRHPIGINLYVVSSDVAKDPQGTAQSLAAIGYREVETGLEGHDAKTIATAIRSAGLSCASLNLLPRPLQGGRSLADDEAVIARDAHELGAAYVTCTLYPLPAVLDMRRLPGEGTKSLLERVPREAQRDDWKRAADFLNRKGAALRREGVRLAYHNHNPEFLPIGETNGLSILLERTDPALVHFHMDAGWVVAAGQDPVTLLRAHPGRFRLMHVKDLSAAHRQNTVLDARTVEVGSGVIDWARVLPAARAAGVRHFTVEQEPPYNQAPLQAAAQSFRWLNALDAG